MPTYGLTHNNLRSFALRGIDSIQPGHKLLVVHTGQFSPFSRRVTALTGIIELSDSELRRIKGFGLDGDTMNQVFLYRSESGKLDYRHAIDSGILPYGMGTDNEFWNPTNFVVDLKMMKKLGIKIQR